MLPERPRRARGLNEKPSSPTPSPNFRDLYSCGVLSGVELGGDGESIGSADASDELDDGLVIDDRAATHARRS